MHYIVSLEIISMTHKSLSFEFWRISAKYFKAQMYVEAKCRSITICKFTNLHIIHPCMLLAFFRIPDYYPCKSKWLFAIYAHYCALHVMTQSNMYCIDFFQHSPSSFIWVDSSSEFFVYLCEYNLQKQKIKSMIYETELPEFYYFPLLLFSKKIETQ